VRIDHEYASLPYVRRIPGLDHDALKPATRIRRLGKFRSQIITLNSPDPQTIRPPDEQVNVLMVTLPQLKVARFDDTNPGYSSPA
jgi:hypothetical protein